MDFYRIGGGFVEILLTVITGFIILGINWRELFIRIFFVSLCVGILGVFATEFETFIYLPIIMITTCLLLYFTTKVKFIFILAAFLGGCITYLSAQAILFSIFPQLTDKYIYAINLLIGLLIILLNGRYQSNISMPKKSVINTNVGAPFFTRYKSIAYLVTLAISYLTLFHSTHFSNREEQFYLAFFSIIFIMFGAYMVKQRYDGQFKYFESSLNEQYDKRLNQYVDLINNQRHVTVDHLLKVRMMLEIGQFQKSKDYLDSLIDETTLTREVASIKSSTIASILLAFKDYAHQKDMILTLDIQDDLSDLPCDHYETHQLLIDLLQLVIDASEKIPLDNRRIKFKINKINNEFLIETYPIAVVDNKTINDIKADHNGSNQIPHNIKNIVNKYQGHINSNFIHNYMHVKVGIPIER